MPTISSVQKDGNLVIITYSDGTVTRKTVAYADAVVSVPPFGSTKVGVIYVDGSGNLIILYDSSTMTISPGGGSGDMTKAVYDPTAVEGDAFDVDNHVDGTTNKVYTATEKTKLAGIEASADVTDATNVNAAGAVMESDGLSVSNDTVKTTIAGTPGDYNRIGDAGITNHFLASEDDLLITGKLEVNGEAYFDGNVVFYGDTLFGDDEALAYGSNYDGIFRFQTGDANANQLVVSSPVGNTVNTPIIAIVNGDSGYGYDFGLWDGLTQTAIAVIDKNEQLHSATDGIADAGAATAILKHIGGFTNAVVGDIVRITAGTLCTAGWYWITTVTSADQATLDRNYTSGDTVDVTFVTYHSFVVLSSEGICTRITDGAPTDASVEIDRDGWIIVDANASDLYWRAKGVWDSVDTHIATHAAAVDPHTVYMLESNIGIADNKYLEVDDAAAADDDFARFTANGIEGIPVSTAITSLLAAALPENVALILDAALSGDGKYSGIVEAGTAGATLAFGDIVYQAVADSRWELAKADVAATSFGKMGICVLAAASDGDATTILLYGKVNAAAVFPSFSPLLAPVYISAATAGDLTSTAPTGTTNFVVRIVGYANTADELFFCPDKTYLELA